MLATIVTLGSVLLHDTEPNRIERGNPATRISTRKLSTPDPQFLRTQNPPSPTLYFLYLRIFRISTFAQLARTAAFDNRLIAKLISFGSSIS